MLNIHVPGNYVPSFGILRTNTTQAHFHSKHLQKKLVTKWQAKRNGERENLRILLKYKLSKAEISI
jgi:hypothetical protein